MIAHREADGSAEIHETQVDFFCRAERGTATLVLRGRGAGARTTAPGELRGAAVKGGERKTLNPATSSTSRRRSPTSSSFAGKEFTYFVIKVDTP